MPLAAIATEVGCIEILDSAAAQYDGFGAEIEEIHATLKRESGRYYLRAIRRGPFIDPYHEEERLEVSVHLADKVSGWDKRKVRYNTTATLFDGTMQARQSWREILQWVGDNPAYPELLP